MSSDDDTGLRPDTVVNVIFYALLLNIAVLVVAFLVLAGVAAVQNEIALANAAGGAATFLVAVGVALGFLRSPLVDLLVRLSVER